MEDEKLRSSMFWNDQSHELQFQQYLKNGIWAKLNIGDFTPPEPIFCADKNMPCAETWYVAKPHNFKGRVHVMVNENCVSSCDAFVWAMKTKLNAELYGFYQAADTAYSRLRLDAVKDNSHKDGFRIEINPERSKLPEGFIVGQVIAVSRSVDENGTIFNGSPLPLKKLVDYKFGEFYPSKVLSTILHILE